MHFWSDHMSAIFVYWWKIIRNYSENSIKSVLSPMKICVIKNRNRSNALPSIFSIHQPPVHQYHFFSRHGKTLIGNVCRSLVWVVKRVFLFMMKPKSSSTSNLRGILIRGTFKNYLLLSELIANRAVNPINGTSVVLARIEFLVPKCSLGIGATFLLVTFPNYMSN